jgi:hypothetical protein
VDRRARLTFIVRSRRAVRSVALRLPRMLSIHARRLRQGLAVKLDGRPVSVRARFVGGVLHLRFARSGRVAVITLSAPALTVIGR